MTRTTPERVEFVYLSNSIGHTAMDGGDKKSPCGVAFVPFVWFFLTKNFQPDDSD